MILLSGHHFILLGLLHIFSFHKKVHLGSRSLGHNDLCKYCHLDCKNGVFFITVCIACTIFKTKSFFYMFSEQRICAGFTCGARIRIDRLAILLLPFLATEKSNLKQ